MRTEKIVYTPEVIMPRRKKQEDTVTLTVPKSTAKAAGMLAASMLALASLAKAEVKHEKYCGDPACETCQKDLSIDSPATSNKMIFVELAKDPKVKNYARVDANTLRYVYDHGVEVNGGNGMVLDLVLDGNSSDIVEKGYTADEDLFPQKDKPLKSQKYLSLAEYSEKVLPRYQEELIFANNRLAETKTDLENSRTELNSTKDTLQGVRTELTKEQEKASNSAAGALVLMLAVLFLLNSKSKDISKIKDLKAENAELKQEILKMKECQRITDEMELSKGVPYEETPSKS